MVSVSGIDVKFGRIAVILIVMGGFTYLYVHYGSGNSSSPVQQQQQPVLNQADESSPKQDTSNDVSTASETLLITLKEKHCKLKYITNGIAPTGSKLNVLLLNGNEFSETTWETTGTMKLLKENSYAAVAVNVTATSDCTGGEKNLNALVMAKVIAELNFTETKLVIISPTASGLLSLPYIFSGDKKAKALLTVMPLIPEDLNVEENLESHKDITIKLVYDKDNYSDKKFEKLTPPRGTRESIKGIGPQYFEKNPEKWINLLNPFLVSLDKPAEPSA